MFKKVICFFIGHKYEIERVYDVAIKDDVYLEVCQRCGKINL